MEVTIEIPEKKVKFVMELLRSLDFLTVKPQKSQQNFSEDWARFSNTLPQQNPDLSEEDIQAEIKAVRARRK